MTIHPITSYRYVPKRDDYESVTLYVAVCGSECSPPFQFASLAMAWGLVNCSNHMNQREC